MQPKYHDDQYIELIHKVLDNGFIKSDRTGTGTISLFGQQMRFNLSGGSIPLLTTKQLHTKSIIHELIWFLKGDTNITYLNDNGVNIWNEWADENGNLGPIYGKQWRDWNGIDQIEDAVNTLKNNPDDRRIIVSAWNVEDINAMALPPCHAMFQFYSRKLTRMERMVIDGSGHFDISDDILDNRGIPKRALSCHLYQRSCDIGLGVPFNIAQYSILTHMMAHVTGHVAEEFVWTGGDTHIYTNHVDQLKQQVTRSPFPSPQLALNQQREKLEDFEFDDFQIIDYVAHPSIKMAVSV